ncbi:MAG: flotillin domain-containing protein, partial [Propionibacteriaceae bacterium]|nr:flotillin domain-containing protein [Propionibacteriaceae bacterium]
IEGAKRGEAEKARRIAEAAAVRAEGEAKAAAVLAVGQAEAEAMDKRAEAFAHYNDAAILQMLVEVLPAMAKEVSAPLGSIDKLTVVSTDGAAALPKQVSENLMQTLQLVKDTTGYDLTSIIDRFANREDDAERRPSGRPAQPTVVEGTVDEE